MRFLSFLASFLLLLAVAHLHHAESINTYMEVENDMIPGLYTPHTATFEDEHGLHASSSVENGIFNEMHRGNIVGGDPTDKTRYPYFTGLFLSNDDGLNEDSFISGGSLIRNDVIVTAARSISSYIASDLVVLVNFTQFGDFSFTHARNVTKIFLHPSYNIQRFANDIALLFLDSPVLEAAPVPLNNDSTNPGDNDILTAIGAGITEFFGSFPTQLLEVDLPIVNETECSKLLLAQGFPIETDTVFCAGYNSIDKSTCNGDGGGPIIAAGDSPETDILIGLSRLSYGCGGAPSVFTRVSAFYDWINCVLDGDCTFSPTSSPTTTPLPVYLQGPTAIVEVSLTTDAYPNVIDISYSLNCSGALEFIAYIIQSSFGNNNQEANTTYNYSFTLPAGQFIVEIFDNHGDDYDVPNFGSLTFSSGGEVIHEIMPGATFFYNSFTIVVGDGGNCDDSGAPLSVAPVVAPADAPHSSPSSPSSPPSKTDDGKCDDLQDVTFPILLNGALVQKTCDWLAGKHRDEYRATMCTEGNDAYDICEETCGKCVDTCVDKEGDFPSLYFRGKMVSCEDLAKHGERWRGKYCDEGRSPMAEKLCKETCNTCD